MKLPTGTLKDSQFTPHEKTKIKQSVNIKQARTEIDFPHQSSA